MTGKMEEQRWCRFGTDGVLVQHEVALQDRGGHRERWLMHQEESFDIVSCRGLGEAQGELFNSAFLETQRSSGSSFNMRI